MTWTRYHRLDDIYKWMNNLASTRPDIVQVIEIGRSVEGRPILVTKVRIFVVVKS